MNKHPNATLLEKLYADFARGDLQSVLDACADGIAFNMPGKSPLAGKYNKSTFIPGFANKLQELSGGTLKTEVHDILASDRHGTVLASDKLTRGGKASEYRVVHVWRFENGKPVAFYEYPRDLYEYDAIWSA
jgi:ketosteroid isomerase-like protein